MVEGINVLLFFQINFLTDFSRSSIKDEVRSVMRPLNLKPTNSRYADYNSQVSTPRRGKGKHSAPVPLPQKQSGPPLLKMSTSCGTRDPVLLTSSAEKTATSYVHSFMNSLHSVPVTK